MTNFSSLCDTNLNAFMLNTMNYCNIKLVTKLKGTQKEYKIIKTLQYDVNARLIKTLYYNMTIRSITIYGYEPYIDFW